MSSSSGTNGNGHGRLPLEVIEMRFPQPVEAPVRRLRKRPLWPAVLLLLLTVVSTLAVGSEFAISYSQNREPFSGPDPYARMFAPFENPRLLVLGVPFSFTLLTILMAHELGHFFACRIYGIDASYPYFIPAPTLFGTFGAFIRIRSPITTRRALFDVGLSGPVVGFVLAAPAMAFAVATSKVVPGATADANILFGIPPLMRGLIALFHPGIDPQWLLLNPIGRAAWVGLFATALNLLPAWQLDGGHILYSVANKFHQRISLTVALALLGIGIEGHGYRGVTWILWGGLLTVLSLRFRHPPLYDPWEPLDRSRRAWAVVALLIFALSFTLWPATQLQ
ncbi:MAG TPA: site-2 protease family protein [Candidatus Limnocylindrales bacterium]|nr:site-2 protease family protein [Candidatus Limnocylindrales bacterium]